MVFYLSQRKGVPLKPAGHVKVVRALIDVDAADKIENPLASGFVKGSSWFLDKLHTGINFVYSSVATGDKYIFTEHRYIAGILNRFFLSKDSHKALV